MRRACTLLAAAALFACSPSDDSPTPTPPPAAPAGVTVASPMPGTLRVSWQAAAGATSYVVYRAAGTIDPATAVRAEVAASAAAGWTVPGLAPGSTWHVAVASVGAAGEGARSADQVADARPLAEITSVTATSTTVSLAWTPVSDGTYLLYRSAVSPVDPAAATAIPVVTAEYVDAVEPGTTYHYAVSAVFDGAESALGPERTVTTPPAAPATLDVAATAPGTLTLTWTGVATATGYTAFCGTASGLPDTATDTASTAATTIDLTGLADGTAYFCAVRAESAAGPGDLSVELWTPTLPAAPAPVAVALVGGASLTWAPVTGATAYVVWWASGTGEVVSAAAACTAEACAWSRTDLGNGVTLQLRVQARNGSGDGPASGTLAVTTLLAPPALSASPGTGEVTLTWTDPNAPAAASYDLYWSEQAPVTLASNRIPGVTSPYVHGPLLLGRTYHYALVAVGAASSSPLSAEASATVARTGLPATPVTIAGVTTFGQSIAAAPGDPESFVGQAGFWDLQPDFSISTGGYDGPFSSAHVLEVGRLATSPPTLDSLMAEHLALDYFPFDQQYGELTFMTPVFTEADGVALAALSDGSTLGLYPLGGARSAFRNATSDSRLQQPLDLSAAAAATIGWTERVFPNGGLVPGDGSSFGAALRRADGTLVEALTPACGTAVDGVRTCSAAAALALGQPVVLSFEFRGAAPGIAELDDVTLAGAGAPALANAGFEAAGGWTTNAGAEPQNVTSGSRTLCVDGPSAIPCPTPLVVTRSFFTAPASPWARIVDVFENPGAAAVTADVVYLTRYAGGGTTVTYPVDGAAGSAYAAYDANATPVRDFGLVFGDLQVITRSASRDGLVTGEGGLFAVRSIVVPAGGRVALATFLVMDGAYSHRGGGTAATGIEQVATAIANGFASPSDSTYRDWLTQGQLDAIVNF
jgi:hypothetical protein